MDDELYDYYGGSIRTHQDHECTEIMENILRKDVCASISDNDKSLLEDFAPKLFNTFPVSIDDLEEAMWGLILCIRIYRGTPSLKEGIKKHYPWKKEGMYSQKGWDNKVKILKDKAIEILEIIEETNATFNLDKTKKATKHFHVEYDSFVEHRNDLIFSLNVLRLIPEAYMPPKIRKISNTKDDIKSYLTGLSLPGKTNDIDNFMERLITN